ncbi:hypothetical protein [Staphylococcus nepalensis]|uniref:Uncharacterized protein n=1 Tax=Staphylococcus nepalensis TaxID=214473 RepID=A0A2T4S846_9STAP|nr:hypothetical protein [Staphylococcus nepalensis]VDG65731.1 Uncharacterised protein [Lacrimispora indolis]PNZ92960.1 hypothetical protein CD130_12910 [Staphylococcus nepalensis]PTK57868.1 hypothetical protein BUZ61_11535 [Staphylococcus nepalensis]SUM53807.1 Uncharacterised protein [Staphylococcus nepalensis]GGB90320.1 hypothetical protein GCM10007203_21780 [Staphylococcus nepalensis]
MVIGLQIAKHSFWYDHGVELLSALVTLAAFIFTFWNITNTNKKMYSDEIKKNDKTLKMIDLVTQKQRKNIGNFVIELEKLKEFEDRENYEILSPFSLTINSKNKHAFILGERAEYFYYNDIEKELNDYLETMKEILNNNHVNLNLRSLEKITDKINNLNNAINQSMRITDIGDVYSIILADSKLPIESQSKIEEMYEAYDVFIELLRETSKKLIEDITERVKN